jgi:hypothetical protein
MRARDLGDRERIDGEHARVLGLLQAAGERRLSLAALDRAGVRNPATVVYELECRGYLINHAHGAAVREFRFDGIADGAVTDVDPRRRPRARRRHHPGAAAAR